MSINNNNDIIITDNSQYNYDILKKKIVLLKDNIIYRMNDSINLPQDHKINKEIVNNYKYNNTILQRVIKKNAKYNKNNNKRDKYKILFDTMFQYTYENNIPIYDSSNLVVHLRLGDIIDIFNKNINTIVNQINLKLKEDKQIQRIIIVTAFHFGQPVENNSFYNSGKYSYNDNQYNKNIEILLSFINKLPIITHIQSCDNIDVDFSYLCTSYHLLTSNGGFSDLIRKINNIYKKFFNNIKHSNNNLLPSEINKIIYYKIDAESKLLTIDEECNRKIENIKLSCDNKKKDVKINLKNLCNANNYSDDLNSSCLYDTSFKCQSNNNQKKENKRFILKNLKK